jgi:hypothetical protein
MKSTFVVKPSPCFPNNVFQCQGQPSNLRVLRALLQTIPSYWWTEEEEVLEDQTRDQDSFCKKPAHWLLEGGSTIIINTCTTEFR